MGCELKNINTVNLVILSKFLLRVLRELRGEKYFKNLFDNRKIGFIIGLD